MDRLLVPERFSSIWPAPYNVLTPEAGYRFLTECWWTLNEADQTTQLIPKKEYVWWFTEEWVNAFIARQPYLCEKSRRLTVSWICRGLETWVMGLSRGDWHLIDQVHANSAQHLWRIHFSLTELRSRRPEFRLGKHESRGSLIEKQATHVVLPNGSMFTQGHQDAGPEQGKGKTAITLEEVSKYRNPKTFWSQAVFLTMGSAEGAGGWVSGIANSSPDVQWHLIKDKASARQLLGME